jgi:hypothetical protein
MHVGKQQQYQSPKTVRNTCAVTGERLDFALPHVTVPDTDRIVYPKHARGPEDLSPDSPFAQGYRVSIPLRFHTRETRHDAAPSIAPAMYRYMEAGEKEAERRRHALAWWNDKAIIAALDAHAQSDEARFSQEELDVALNWLSGFRGSEQLGNNALYWVKRAVTRVRRYVADMQEGEAEYAYEAAA